MAGISEDFVLNAIGVAWVVGAPFLAVLYRNAIRRSVLNENRLERQEASSRAKPPLKRKRHRRKAPQRALG